jgi:hypothetical protein
MDTNLSGSVDLTYMFVGPGDVPLAADVNGDGIADLAIYRNGTWYIDTNRNGNGHDGRLRGAPQDIPLLTGMATARPICIFGMVLVREQKRDGVADVIRLWRAG